MDEDRPEILDTGTEKEILYQRVVNYVIDVGFSAIRQDCNVGEDAGTIAGMAVTGVLRALRVMSGRQLAVLLAEEANRGVGCEIHEPPYYSPEEIENVS